MRICITTFAAMIGLAASAEALTLKTGEVLGPNGEVYHCLLYTSPSPRDATLSRMPSSA